MTKLFDELTDRFPISAAFVGAGDTKPPVPPRAPPRRWYHFWRSKTRASLEKWALEQEKDSEMDRKHQHAMELVDQQFRDSLEAYSTKMREGLTAMYLDGENVHAVDGLIAKTGYYGNWTLEVDESGPSWQVQYSTELKHTPLLLKLTLLHEISGHVGQGMVGIEKHGFANFVEKVASTREFMAFTEMSAAALENRTFTKIPFDLLHYDVATSNLPAEAKRKILSDYSQRWQLTLHQAVTLEGRGYGFCLNHAEIKQFLRKIPPR